MRKSGVRKIDKNLGAQDWKEIKIRKIIEFFEPVRRSTSIKDQDSLKSSDVVVNDDIVDTNKEERVVVRNAFTIWCKEVIKLHHRRIPLWKD